MNPKLIMNRMETFVETIERMSPPATEPIPVILINKL